MVLKTLIDNLSLYKLDIISGESFWELQLNLELGQEYKIEYIQRLEDLEKFGRGLSEWSKDMFCPYPWNDSDQANPAFRELIEHHNEKGDLAYLMFDKEVPVGLFFLWNIKSNIPELGEGIIDAYQNRGFGGFALDMLTEIADILGVDAVELTTDLRNEAAKHLYESRGYEVLGIIKNALEIDQTKDISELKEADKFREEYHMAKIFRNRERVLEKLKQKRDKQKEFK